MSSAADIAGFGSDSQPGVHRHRLADGRQTGVDVIDLHNGRLSIRVCPTRGMGILFAQCGNLRLGWDSPCREIVHPRHIDLRARGGRGWLDGFNEFVVRCGLASIGRPGWDDARLANPSRREFLTLHGKIANTPAREVRTTMRSGRLAVIGRVRERADDGGVLELATTISTRRGLRSFRISDVVTNRGNSPAELQVLYHVNLGVPLLEAGARFLAPVESVTGIDVHCRRRLAAYDRYGSAVRGFKEEVYLMRLRAGRGGQTVVALRNRARDAAVSLRFSIAALPCMTLWKQCGAFAERFVTGLEPGTSFPHHRSVERRAGRVMVLAPGASHRMTVTITAHEGPAAVTRLQARIAALQGRARPRLLTRSALAARGCRITARR